MLLRGEVERLLLWRLKKHLKRRRPEDETGVSGGRNRLVVNPVAIEGMEAIELSTFAQRSTVGHGTRRLTSSSQTWQVLALHGPGRANMVK